MAAATPQKYDLSMAEVERIEKLAKINLQSAEMELHQAEEDTDEWEDDSDDSHVDVDADVEMDTQEAISKATLAANQLGADKDDLAIYNLDDYDKETSKSSAMGAFSNIKGLSYYADNDKDPYITLKEGDSSDDEQEDLEIYATDNLLVAAKTQDDVSQLDIYVYDESNSNLYIHHDLLLPAMPLALECLSYAPAASISSASTNGKNYVAVATMDPEIEIWNLDVIDGLYPDAILGGKANPSTSLETMTDSLSLSTSKKKRKKIQSNDQTHTDAVLALSWNQIHQSLLISASADKTMKLWDLTASSLETCLRSYSTIHSNKVSAVQWNYHSPTIVLSGAWGGTVKVFDTRSTADQILSTSLGSDIECLQWNKWKEAEFLVGCEDGSVHSFDSRMLSSATITTSKDKARLWKLDAHQKAVSCLDYCPMVEGLLVTGSADKTVKIWNVDSSKNGKYSLSLITSRDLGVGNVFSANFCPDDPSTLAIAGSQGSLQIWDTACNAGVRSAFGEKFTKAGKDLSALSGKGNGGLISIEANDDDDDADQSDEE